LIIFILFCSSPLFAVPVEELDPNREWRTKDLIISDNEKVGTSELKDSLSTKTRPGMPWRAPGFDPAVFASDLERMVRFYQDKGYYEAKVSRFRCRYQGFGNC
jgi:outer membrane protein assembly factor BamA